jgi:preprotein translocase subunit SecA
LTNFVSNLVTGIFGSRNQRLIKRYEAAVQAANAIEVEIGQLGDDTLRGKTAEFRERYAKEQDLDALLPEAFAVVRESARRTLGMRHFDVQLIGGIALHEGKIAEMRTGEGKTLVATLAAYLNALPGTGVHIVTVNDYLARRDAAWMGPVYEFLGLEVGVILSGQTVEEKRAAYAADITYGTNNEFGFDYLRDNLAFRLQDRVQRDQAFAIVDEVDSILIDEARTPLIISGRSEESTELYVRINKLIPKLTLHDPPPGSANEEIQSPKVEVIGVKHESLGQMSLGEALQLAREQGLHLVELADTVPAAKGDAEEGDSLEPSRETDTKKSKVGSSESRRRVPQCLLFVPGDYTIDEKAKQAHLTEEGHERVEGLFAKAGILGEGESLYDAGNIRLMHHLNAALRAHALFKREVDYIVSNGDVVIVDEFTGRTMPGRRWSDGLHQAIEAKEGVRVKEENQTVASITFQNYFRLYDKLAGMTGTADTEAYEFQQIYGLEVVVIPTHKPMIRDDAPDLVYLTQEDKFAAIVEDIKDCHESSQPVLVGTTTIETSEFLSGLLKQNEIPHQVLNAKYHEREAEIVAQAGRPGAVTIATNMAGRGTDIVLGGNWEAEKNALGDIEPERVQALHAEWQQRHERVIEVGGLHIVGTERHESRRIDNQLRGRSGRQGDPGSSRFYLSMEDNLMRIFGDPERTKRMLSRAGMKAGEAIESKLLSRQIERAQRKVEAHNFDIRKNLLEYDDVANDQRKVVYQQRNGLMEAEDIADAIVEIREEVVDLVVAEYVPPGSVEEMWDKAGLQGAVEREFGIQFDVDGFLDRNEQAGENELRQQILSVVEQEYAAKEAETGAQLMRELEKGMMLRQLDMHWKEHLAALDYLRQGVGLRSFAQRNPKQEYKREAFEMFTEMLDRVKRDTIGILSKIQIKRPEDVSAVEPSAERAREQLKFQHAAAPSLAAAAQSAPASATGARLSAGAPVGAQSARTRAEPLKPPEPFVREHPKVGRNQPCPCGSGKKFKQCHGKLS